MDRISAARAFVTVVEQGSFIKAARLLNTSRASVTRLVNDLEHWTQSKLLHRSTRRLSLTPVGEEILEHCRDLIGLADMIKETGQKKAQAPQGTLRIACAPYFAEIYLMPVIAAFSKRYPAVTVELSVSDTTIDLIEERIDLSVRITNDLDPNLIARRIGESRSVLCASPAYLAEHGTPSRLEDLSSHNCLIYSGFDRRFWFFERDGDQIPVPVGGTFVSKDADMCRYAALQQLGIAMQPIEAVLPHFQSGELVPVLRDWEPVRFGIYGIFLSRKNMSSAQRKMLDMLVAHMKTVRETVI